MNGNVSTRGVSPVAGVILMVALTVLFIGILAVVLVSIGVFGLSSLFNFEPYLVYLLVAYGVLHTIRLGYRKHALSNYNLSEAVEFNPVTIETPTDETGVDEVQPVGVKTSIELPTDSLQMTSPVIVAPANTNPINWGEITELNNHGAVIFITTTESVDEEAFDSTVITPDTVYGDFEAIYTVDEFDELVVYDAMLEPISKFDISQLK